MNTQDERDLRLEELLDKAHEAARVAADEEEETNGHLWYPCGFAWVTISGTSELARHCREVCKSEDWTDVRARYGDKDYPRGWTWWCPGHVTTQRMETYKAAAQAFAGTLNNAGIDCKVNWMMD